MAVVVVVVGGGSGKVFPKGKLPLWPKLTRRGTVGPGLALDPLTKYALPVKKPISPGE